MLSRRAPGLAALLLACSAGVREAPRDAAEGDASSGAPLPPGCAREVCFPYACDLAFGFCRTSCQRSDECVDRYACLDGACVGTGCTEATARALCGPYACVRGECATSCATIGCVGSYYCRGDTQRCVPRCTSRHDPVCQGYACDTSVGECEPYCHAGEIDCADGFRCDLRDQCVPAPL